MLFTLPGGDITAGGFLAAGITVLVVTGFFIAIRIINGLSYSKRLFADDYLAVFAWVLQAITFGLYIKLTMNIAALPNKIPLRDFLQFLIAEAFIGGFAIYFAKVPVLILFVRLFGNQKPVRYTVWITLCAGFVLFLSTLLYVSVECSAGRVNDQASLFVCIGSAATNGLIQGIGSLILDIIVFVTPLPVVWNLNLSINKKIGLCIVFAAGVVAIITSSITLYYKVLVFMGSENTTFGIASIILSFIEASIAIIVGCVPALRSFWINQLPNLIIYSKIQSLFSRQTSTGSRSAPKSSNQHQGDSSECIVGGIHIELHEGVPKNDTHEHAHCSI